MSCLKDHSQDIHDVAEDWEMGDAIIIGHIKQGIMSSEPKPRVLCCGARIDAIYVIIQLMEMMEITPSRLLEVIEAKAIADRDNGPDEALRQIKELLKKRDDECE